MPTNAELLDLYEQTVSSIDEVCATLSDEEWARATDLQGWTVKDNLSHLVHYEEHTLGRPSPEDVDISRYEYVTGDFQAVNERGVEYRRAHSGARLLDEFRQATTERIKTMRDLDEAGWQSTFDTPAGGGRYDQFMPVRILDLYYHEQDIRRAVGKSGHLGGAVARMVFDRFSASMGYVVGKVARAPEGTRVRFAIGAPGETFDIVMGDGRGQKVPPSGEPHVTFEGDIETFLCLVGGRWTPQAAIVEDRWNADGDEALIERIHAGIAVVP